MMFQFRYRVAFVALLGAGVFMPALADPPARVARLAYSSGTVSFSPAGADAWLPAELNRPLVAGDRLWADAGARDEVQLGSAALRMDGATLLTLLNQTDRVTQLQLSQGRLDFRVRRLAAGEVLEIDTPNLTLSIRAAGDFRLEVDPDGMATTVLVRSGWAAASGGGRVYSIGPGQAYRFAGAGLADVEPVAPDGGDDFDRWADARERRIAQSRSARYVPPDLVGYADLDDGGVWRSVAGYGYVWQPLRVGPDWAPYRDGHWAWVEPWGWTWIDAAPWGYAVSHYGRWAYLRNSWCWVPGPRTVRPVYAPALVVFVDAGGVRAPRLHTAWFPLAPREVYRPPYQASHAYITNINISNTNIDRRRFTQVYQQQPANTGYANRQVRNAVVAVPTTTFARAEPVAAAALALPREAVLRAPPLRSAPVAPPHVRPDANRQTGERPPAAALARQATIRTAPPPAMPLSGRQPRFAARPGRPPEPGPLPMPPASGPRPAPHMPHIESSHPVQSGALPVQPSPLAAPASPAGAHPARPTRPEPLVTPSAPQAPAVEAARRPGVAEPFRRHAPVQGAARMPIETAAPVVAPPPAPARPEHMPPVPARPEHMLPVPARPEHVPPVPARPEHVPPVPARPEMPPLPVRPEHVPPAPARPEHVPVPVAVHPPVAPPPRAAPVPAAPQAAAPVPPPGVGAAQKQHAAPAAPPHAGQRPHPHEDGDARRDKAGKHEPGQPGAAP